MTPQDLVNQSTTKVNTAFNSQLNSCLLSSGLLQEDIDAISFLYQSILGESEKLSLLPIATKGLATLEADLKAAVAATQADIAASDSVDKKSGVNENYSVQDAKFGKTLPEKNAIITRTTNMPDFPAANSELSSEYPDTYGKMDEAQNWFKVNRATKYLEYVHSSGSSIKVDKLGNVSIRITGNLKFIIDKDFLINVLGNHDYAVIGNENKTTLGDLVQVVGKTANIRNALLTKILSASVEIN